MRIEHGGGTPRVHPSAWVAPNVTLSGEVEIGPGTRILYGAVVTAEGAPVRVGAECVVMEQAVLRGTPDHPLVLGDHVLVGPQAHLTGCTVADDVFLATGCAVFTGARIGRGAEVRIHGVVHLRTELPAFATVPIAWVAVGAPCRILPPDAHDEIWAVQGALDFPGTVFGVERPPQGETRMPEIMHRYSESLGRHHRDDRTVEDD